MSDRKVFVDTNILLYAHDSKAGERQDKAARLLCNLWDDPNSVFVSVQVLQELLVNLVRKGVELKAAAEVVEDLQQWEVVSNSPLVFNQGIKEHQRFGLSLWDSFILAAARVAGAEVIFTEDFNNGQDYEGVLAVNPLLS